MDRYVLPTQDEPSTDTSTRANDKTHPTLLHFREYAKTLPKVDEIENPFIVEKKKKKSGESKAGRPA